MPTGPATPSWPWPCQTLKRQRRRWPREVSRWGAHRARGGRGSEVRRAGSRRQLDRDHRGSWRRMIASHARCRSTATRSSRACSDATERWRRALLPGVVSLPGLAKRQVLATADWVPLAALDDDTEVHSTAALGTGELHQQQLHPRRNSTRRQNGQPIGERRECGVQSPACDGPGHGYTGSRSRLQDVRPSATDSLAPFGHHSTNSRSHRTIRQGRYLPLSSPWPSVAPVPTGCLPRSSESDRATVRTAPDVR
jgi:hypothetical protein